nr:DUF6516 family protein [Bordetella petrii]
MIDRKSSRLIINFKSVDESGAIIQMVVWQVPHSVPPSLHRIKYRLVYVVNGERVLGFDNERGKGDHRHWGNEESPYHFVSIDRLIEDFLADVARHKEAS